MKVATPGSMEEGGISKCGEESRHPPRHTNIDV